MEACVAVPPGSAADGTGPKSSVFSLWGCRGLVCLRCDCPEHCYCAVVEVRAGCLANPGRAPWEDTESAAQLKPSRF